jgi:hypothetical protein
MHTIFERQSLSRNEVHWEDYLFAPTPVEKHGDLWFKREDTFAPLGYGGINGAKLRQCIWLVNEYVQHAGHPIGVISGTSVKSPQLPMGSAVAMHYGLESLHIIGATKPSIAHKHENVAMATWFGAKFYVNPHIAYNPVLQRKVQDMREHDSHLKDYFYLEYGITLDHHRHSPESIEQFHTLGAAQVQYIPEHIENIIIPAGSCNSCTSVLYGIARHRPPNLKHVYLIGIGPNKIDFMEERLDIIHRISGVDTKPFRRQYHDSPSKQDAYTSHLFAESDASYEYQLHHYDLHSTHYVDYQDEMPYTYHDIELHPTYEGKVMTYVMERLPHLIHDRTLFWIVGSKPRKESMYHLLHETLGEYPNAIHSYA